MIKKLIVLFVCFFMVAEIYAQKLICETDSAETTMYTDMGYTGYMIANKHTTVVGAYKKGYRPKYLQKSKLKKKGKDYVISELTKFKSHDDFGKYFEPAVVKIAIPERGISYKVFNKTTSWNSGKADEKKESQDSLNIVSPKLLENAYWYFQNFGVLDTTEGFFRDYANTFKVSMTVHRMKLECNKQERFVLAKMYCTIELTDYYGAKIFSKEFEVQSNDYPDSFLSPYIYWFGSLDSFLRGEYGVDVWNDVMEEAYLQFFYSPELAMAIESYDDKLKGASDQPLLTLKTTKNNGSSPSDYLKTVVTIKSKDGHGSGCIVSTDGYVVTNYHVAMGSSDTLHVVLSDGTDYIAKVERSDVFSDLALLKIEAKNLFASTPVATEMYKLGEELLVIGTPADPSLGQTVTKGIMSGKRSTFGKTLFQTDAHVNPGNSGGALFNSKGQLIGVVSSKAFGSTTEGVGFAIPSNYIYERLRLTFN
jgi:S1-C subfamily serine protease